MNQVADLRRVLAEEVGRLQAQPGLERRIIDRAVSPSLRAGHGGRRESGLPVAVQSPRPMSLVAGLLAIAVIATLVFTAHALQTSSGPGKTPQRPYTISPPPPATGSCSSVPRQWASSPPNPAKMTTTVGWAYGPMHTTDGGLHWVDVSPPSISGRTPKNDEYFLDGTHAWVAEAASSSAACVDHVVVFSTRNAGRTWQQSAPIPVRFTSPSDVLWTGHNNHAALFAFVDAQHGWLLLGSGPASPDNGSSSSWIGAAWRVGDLFRTTDGGLHWELAAADPGSQVGCVPYPGGGVRLVNVALTFSSGTTGWMASSCGLLVSHDAGNTWAKASLPRRASESPTFFDAGHGAVLGDDGLLMSTADGGVTWIALPNIPPAPTTFYGVDFIDQFHAWAVGEGSNPAFQCDWAELSACNGNFRLYRTIDGGQSWTPGPMTSLMMPAPKWWPPAYLHFCDGRNGFLSVGEDPLEKGLFRTSDGGLTWTRVDAKIQRP